MAIFGHVWGVWGHGIGCGKALRVDCAPIKKRAKSDNFKVPKNGPKVAKMVVTMVLRVKVTLNAHQFLRDFKCRFLTQMCSAM